MQNSTLTPAERLAIYEKMLPYFEGEERILDEEYLPDDTFCFAIGAITDEGCCIEDFPELDKHNPLDGRAFWFPRIKKGPDHTRTAILHQAINEVKQLINEPSILP